MPVTATAWANETNPTGTCAPRGACRACLSAATPASVRRTGLRFLLTILVSSPDIVADRARAGSTHIIIGSRGALPEATVV